MKNKKLISIVVPVYNEQESISPLYSEVSESLKGHEFEIIFVNDGSSDQSREEVLSIMETENIYLIDLYKNYGKSAALSEGFKYSKGDYIITLDADLQDDPKEILKLIDALETTNYDIISGWKKNRMDPLSKRLPSKLFNFTTRLFTGIKIHDFNCGLKAYTKKVIKSIEIYGGMHRYIPVIAKQKGFLTSECEVNHRPRKFGQTKYGGARFLHGFFDLITVLFLGKYLQRPLHFFGFFGLINLIAGLSINAYLTIGWFNGYAIGNRPILFLGILLIIIGIQFISLGLLGELIIKSNSKTENRVSSVCSLKNINDEKNNSN